MNPVLVDTWQLNENDFFEQKTPEEKVKFLLRYAILAPSTHNSQPWLFKIESPTSGGVNCKIYYDPALRLPQADPKGRDLYISMGCLIENLVIAAQYFNVYERIVYYPDKDNLVAEVFFKSEPSGTNAQWADLFHAIPKRINARGIFKPTPIENSILDAVIPADIHGDLKADFITDKDKIKKLAELTGQGIRMAYASDDFRKEMSQWMHSSFSKKREGLLGYSLKMPALISLFIPRMVKFFNISPLLAKLNYKSLSSAPMVCTISALNNYPATWLQVGRLAERLMLGFNARNVKTSVFVAAIEMGNLSDTVKQLMETNYLPQFLFCAGYMDGTQPHSPRHPLENKIIK